MNIQVMDRVTTGQKINLAIADCDIHPTPKSVPAKPASAPRILSFVSIAIVDINHALD